MCFFLPMTSFVTSFLYISFILQFHRLLGQLNIILHLIFTKCLSLLKLLNSTGGTFWQNNIWYNVSFHTCGIDSDSIVLNFTHFKNTVLGNLMVNSIWGAVPPPNGKKFVKKLQIQAIWFFASVTKILLDNF